jgi:hypothetical protein
MPFAFVSPKITQSGTDTDATIISGLSAIAGVTTIAESGGRTRIIIPYLFDITSVFSPSPLIAFTFTAQNSPANIVTVTSTGRWNYKQARTLNGLTTWRRMPPIIFTRAVNNGYNNNNNNLIYVLGGILDLGGVEIIGNGGQYWQGGTIILRDVVINAEGLADSNDNQITTQAGNPTLDIDGLEIRGASMFLKDCVITQLNRLQPKFVSRGFGNGFGLQKTLQNFDSQGAVFDIAIYSGGAIRCNNPVKGGGVTVGPWNATSNVNNESYCTADLLLTGINELGAAVLFKAYHIDNNTNAPVGAGVTATNYTLRKTYNVLATVGGVATMNILLAASLNDGTMRRRSVSLTDDLYRFNCFSYLSLPVVTTPINLAGAGIKTATAVQLKDPSISQLTKATVDAYTALDTLDRLYDRAKAFIFDTFAGETAGLFVGAGSTLDAGSKNIVIDATAATAFAYNAGSNTITLKSSLLTAGTKFLTLATTGTVSAINGASIASIEILGNVTQATPAALTGVQITGTLTYNTATTAQFTFTNCILATVNNSGAGIVTIKRVNSTLTSGTNIAAYLPTTLVFGLNGGRIRVLDHLGVEQFNQTADGTFELSSVATGTWSYKIVRYGSKAIEGTFSINGTTIAITPAYIPDTAVVATLAAVSAYTVLGTTQQIYDYYCYALTTTAGILLTKSVTLTASVFNLGAYTLDAGAMSLSASVIGINTATVTGVNVVTTGSLAGVIPTYPQQLTSAAGSTNWLNITLAPGQVCRDTFTNVFSTASSITLLPATATGSITIYVAKRGFKKQVVTVPYSTNLLPAQAFTLIPDSNVVDLVSDLSAASFTSSQAIYDAFSQYQSTATGILDTYTPSKSPGAIDFGTKGFALGVANDFSATPLAIKSTGLVEDAYYSQQNFTQGTATLANSVLIRALNFDSEIVFTPDSIAFYPSQAARDTGTTPGVTAIGGVYRFKHGSTVSGVLMSGTIYVRVTVGSVGFFAEISLAPGANIMDLSVQGQLTSLNNRLDAQPSKLEIAPLVWGAAQASYTAPGTTGANQLPVTIPAAVDPWSSVVDGALTAGQVLNVVAATCAGKATGGGTDTITLRNLSDTTDAVVMTVDVNGNRSGVTLTP